MLCAWQKTIAYFGLRRGKENRELRTRWTDVKLEKTPEDGKENWSNN